MILFIIYSMHKSFQKGKSSSMKPMLVEVLLLLILWLFIPVILSVWLWHICSGQQIYRIVRGQGRGMEEARKVSHPFPLPKGFKVIHLYDHSIPRLKWVRITLGLIFFFHKILFLFQAPVIYRQRCHSWYYSNENSFFFDDYFFVFLFSCMFIQGMNQMKSPLFLNLFKQKKFCQQY